MTGQLLVSHPAYGLITTSQTNATSPFHLLNGQLEEKSLTFYINFIHHSVTTTS